MSYEFTKDCEIRNAVFKKGDVIGSDVIPYYPTVMKPSDKEPSVLLSIDTNGIAKKTVKTKDAKDDSTKKTTSTKKTASTKKAVKKTK